MLKRTTIYLDSNEVLTLKKISFIQSVSMAELIRREVQQLCKTFSKEQQAALTALSEIKTEASKKGISTKDAMDSALKLQKEIRRERKTSRR